MNPIIETMVNHRSIRKFTSQPISNEQLATIIESGRCASSSNLIQGISIIRITDKAKRAELARLAGNQSYVETAAEFLVFCMDYHRHEMLSQDVKLDSTELLIIGAVDTAIMAQNCLLAAESMGLGGVFIGGLRNHPKQVDELLELPQHCAVLFGMCLGHPAQNPESKPRLSPDVYFHENSYQPATRQQIEQYDHIMSEYYQVRSDNTKQMNWSKHILATLSKDLRPHMLEYFQSKGLAKK